MKRMYGLLLLLVCLASNAFAMSAEEQTKLEAEVRAAETAFAKSMADRDPKAFAKWVADDAVFFGRNSVSRGKSCSMLRCTQA